jgi:hypothetical protein
MCRPSPFWGEARDDGAQSRFSRGGSFLSNSNDSKFLVRHPWDQYAFPVFVALIWLVILMGFVPDIVLKYRKQGFHYPLAVHIHAAVYVS